MRPNRLSPLFILCAAAVAQAAPSASQYAKIPLAFERQGEASHERYVARGNGYQIALQEGSAAIGLQSEAGSNSSITMNFAGARKVSGTAGAELPGKVNYLHGSDPKQWRLGLATYDSVTYREIYPATDVVYRGNQRQMEFDLVLRPGADPGQIRLRFGGASDLRLDGEGALVVGSSAGDLRVPLPVIYQEMAGARKTVKGRYALLANHEVGFRLDAYDRGKPLVIDPTIVYAGLIGGGTNTTVAYSVALDSTGNTYITGYTYASDFPTANAAFSQMHATPDGFVSKIDPTGTTLLYSTYIGGANTDVFHSIAVDSTGAAWVTGYTYSVDFPLASAYQSTLNGSYNAVVLKLTPSGGLAFSTYLGASTYSSSADSYGYGIAVDPAGNVYATGYVDGGFNTTAGAYQTSSAGSTDAFVTKFSSSGGLVYSTLLGGTNTDVAYAIAADAGGNAYVTGYSYSTGFANVSTGGAQPANAGNSDAFVAKVNPAGSALGYFTFLGGSSWDYGSAIAVDAGGNAYVGGYTNSTDFPATAGALQTVPGGAYDGFVAKLNSAGSAFSYATYLGGSRQDYLYGLAIDGSGNAYVTGRTNSSQFPTASAIEGNLPGNTVSLFGTTSSATSWTPFDTNLQGAVSSISPDPSAPGAIVAATEFGIFRSANAGLTWTKVSTAGSAYLSRSPVSNSILYGITCCNAAVYQSMDGGATWNYRSSPSSNATRIVADPASGNIAYAYYAQSGYPLLKSTDGGATWNPATNGLPSTTPNIYTMVAASDGSLYVDISGSGVYKSTNQGATWVSVNSGLGSTSAALNGLAVSPSNPAVLYKSVNSNVIYKTTNGGGSWAVVSGAPFVLTALAVSPSNPSVIAAAAPSAYFQGLYISSDGGATWNPAGTGLGIANVTQIVADPTNSSGAYAIAGVLTSAFAAEINPTGSALVYSTYLGSSSSSYGEGIAVNSSGDAFVTGYGSGAFPVTSTAFQGSTNSTEAFLVRISGATASCTFSVSPAPSTIYSSTQLLTYSVMAPGGCAWSAGSNQSWASVVSGASGSGPGLVTVAVASNSTGAVRTAGLTIASQYIPLTQAPSSCLYTLGTPSASLAAGGGTAQTTVLTGTGCPWIATNNYPSAVSVVSGASGTGNGAVTVNVAANPQQTPRTLSIPIGNATLSITQAGYCSYVFTPAAIVLNGSGGSGSMAVTTQSGCGWTASSNNTSWLTITNSGTGIGTGTVNYTALAISGTNRSTSISIAGTSVTVNQTLGQAYIISTLAGGLVEPPTTTTATSFSIPNYNSLAVDSSGNVYFPGPSLWSVFKADVNGVVTRVAGTGVSGYLGDGGPALNARLSAPEALAVDPVGNLYIADTSNNRIRKVDTNGIITTVAGNGTSGSAGDGGLATAANLNAPQGLALDSLGNLYIVDYNNYRIRKITAATGIITTVAGSGSQGYSGDGGQATSAQLNNAQGVAVDALGNLYIADGGNRRVRKVDTNGIITTLAGNGSCCFSGDGDPAIGAQINTPTGVAVDASGNLYIADISSPSIRKVAPNGIITTVAGNSSAGFSGDGGPATSALLGGPRGVAVDASGTVYISDVNNERIRKISGTGVITTIVGGGIGDSGAALMGGLNQPRGVVRDSAGNTYIADQSNHRVRKVAANGVITTVAGTGTSGYSGDSGPAGSAMLNQPYGVALDSTGNLYIADAANHRVRKVDANGNITTVAGTGTSGYSGDGGSATSAQINFPTGVAFDTAGNLYIADSSAASVRKVAVNGTITTIAGYNIAGYSGDGGLATSALLNSPQGVAVDSAGNVYIADASNNRIRKITAATGIITTVAGNGNSTFSGDGGLATSAQINNPAGVYLDAAGNLYIAENNNQRVRKVDTSGIITTIAGNGSSNYSGDGGPATSANLRNPVGVFVDPSGNVYVAEVNNNAIRLLTPVGTLPVLTIQSTHTGNFTQGQNGASYTVTVSNAAGAGATTGGTGVTEFPPTGLTLVSMSGSGWACNGVTTGTCTRSDTLSGGSSYPPITVTVNVAANAPAQVTAQLLGASGTVFASAIDFTIIAPASAPPPPVLVSPANGATGVPLAPTLAWNASTGATSYDVYFGTSGTPPFATTTADTNYAPGTLSSSATYYWSVTAKNGVGGAASGVWSFGVNCVSPLNPSTASFGQVAGTGSVPVTAPSGCGWVAQSNASWLLVTGGTPGSGNGTVNYSVAANMSLVRTGTITIGGQTFTVTQSPSVFASETYLVSTLAGGLTAPTAATAASVSIPMNNGIAVDSTGNVYFPSPILNAVFKTDTNGVVTQIAGTGVAGFSGDGGTALSAMLNSPSGIALDSLGNLYIADSSNQRIRKLATTGVITTVAGNGTGGFSGDGVAATSTRLNSPGGVWVDTSGNIYIADSSNHRIRKVASTGIITTVAGTGTAGFAGDSGFATSAQINSPQGVASDSAGNLYIADYNNQRVRKVDTSGIITTVAGTGTAGNSGDNGPPLSAQLNYPAGVLPDASGNLYIACSNGATVRKVATGVITTVAGNGNWGFFGDGGPATSANLSSPRGVALDTSGNLYIADTGNFRVRKVSAGTITTLVGGATGDGGPGVLGSFDWPQAVVGDGVGNTYIADSNNNGIRKVAAGGTISTAVGTGTSGFAGDAGAATSARLSLPQGVAMDGSGNLYVADSRNARIRKIATNGTITTVAGNGTSGYSGDAGQATSAQLNYPYGVALDTSGNLYIADANNHSVRKVALNGIITTIAGNGTSGSTGDGGQATSALLNNPLSLAVDPAGNVYIADGSNHRIRKVTTATGIITAVVGTGTAGFSGDGGPATSAQLNYPNGVALDAAGNIYISDQNNRRVRKVDLSGNITTIAGTGGYSYSGDGGPAENATFRNLGGLFVDALGNVYVADQNNNAIRLLTPMGTSPVLTIQSTSSGAFTLGQTGATYTVTVRNAVGAGPTSGTVTVTEVPPTGLTLVSMSGSGWSCSTNTCIRGDVLAAGASYPAITVTLNVAANAPSQLTNQVTMSGGGAIPAGASSFATVTPVPLRFIPVTPCRIVDTRNATGPFGGPIIAGGSSRDFTVPNSACSIPATAQAYSLNVAVVPATTLGYLTLYPAGQSRPLASTLNSLDGRIKSNAAIVAAGTGGAVSVFASDTTQVILDINGYFVPATDPTGLAFYPITPCRIGDTRTAAAPLGGPALVGGQSRTFPIQSSTCNLPATAQAYSLNFAAVPGGSSLGYLTAFPTGQTRPVAASLNALTGAVTANAAIVPAGANGSIDVFVSDNTNLVIDINGYFAPMGTGGLSLYGVTPCRVLDTRQPTGSAPISSLDVPVSAKACGIPGNAQAQVMSVTVVPQGTPAYLGYLTMWPQGLTRPVVSTLNALDGAITSNLAIVPTSNGWISAFASNPTHLIIDISGYFAQ